MNENARIIEKLHHYRESEAALRLEQQELSQLLQALRSADEQRAILSSIIESTDDAILSKDLNGVITSWNRSAERIFGYTAAEMIGMPIMKLIPAHLHDEEPRILQQLRKGIRVDHFETQRLRKDGTLIDVSLTISPLFDREGKITGISKIVRDMTVYRKAEVDKRRLTAIVESSDDAIISKDLNSVITSWNDAACRIFGYNASEMVGESILKIIPIDRHDEETKILNQIRQGIRVEHFDTERLRKDGSLISVSLTISPIKDSSGTVIGVSKIARDITYKKQLEKKKDEFVAFVSHELKTPLTSLKSYIQVARQKTNDEKFLCKALDRAEVQAKKMETIITDFLHISRFEEGKLRLNISRFDLCDLIGSCISDAEMVSTHHPIVFEDKVPILVEADREKIGMVVTNLISNAQKYAPNGGIITISCKVVGNQVSVFVQDQGMGISKEDQDRMFQKFHRVENEETKTISGFGIGLYLVATILQEHGTKIQLESELGKGSTFGFQLRLADSD